MQDSPANYLRRSFAIIKLFSLYIYVALSIVIIILDSNHAGTAKNIRNFIIDVGFGISRFTGTGVINFKTIISDASEYFSLHEKNIKLHEEVKVLEDYYLKTQNVIEENKQIRKLMNLLPDLTPSYKTTKVLGDTYNIFSTTLMINGGTTSGMKKGQVALNELGLVGRVIDIYDNVSRLMLLTDLNSRVPIITQQSRERAIITGNGNNKLLRLLYMPEDSNATVGEAVITSGDGILFPAGIVVGKISEIKNKEYVVSPSVDFSRLDYVILVERLVSE